jgi:Protein of unknown function (DUF1648)
MNRRLFTILTALMWLALPLTALRYWQVWDQLPVRMATHFTANGQPNGWMPREVSMYYALGLTAFTLVIFTGITSVILKQKAAPDSSSLALLAFFYLIQGFVFHANDSVLNYNLSGRPLTVGPMLLGVLVAIVLFSLVYLRARRGATLPEGQTLAEEVHNSPVFATLFVALAAVQIVIVASVPLAGVRVAMGLMGLLFLLIAVQAWSGFQYRFTPAGLEISTLGFRLRSISRDQIGYYGIEKWTALRGYGIRGVGNTRAYVWGNQVVHITTLEGEVFLGHNDPARIVRDLDTMKQFAHS